MNIAKQVYCTCLTYKCKRERKREREKKFASHCGKKKVGYWG